MKGRTSFICQSCGYDSPRWLGRCPGCGEWNTLAEEKLTTRGTTPAAGGAVISQEPRPLTAIEAFNIPRLKSPWPDVDRVLGEGLVPGSVTLLGGEPGIGKSTFLLQLSEQIAARYGTVLYISGEESIQQSKIRATRLGVTTGQLLLAAETNLEAIAAYFGKYSPQLVVIDSIQTVYLPDLAMAPGSVGQVREATHKLMTLAKALNIPVILVGHVTKDGSLAGPKVLEHMVDTVLSFEGDRRHHYRVLRAIKNRFGPTNETAIFMMRHQGLEVVTNPSALFLSARQTPAAGIIVMAAIQGTMPVLVEVEALVAKTAFGYPRRNATGFDLNRLNMLVAVLERRAGLKFENQDIYVNIAGGLEVDEPAADLGVALALASSLVNLPVPQSTVITGELGLTGEIRLIGNLDKRLQEAGRQGFSRAVIPVLTEPLPELGLETWELATIREAVEKVLGGLA